ncbi:MAG: hypothetical protein BZY88_02355 [SAR202 cluster bacterium Io17-Chloro-G9]|nr:MAG: hypothetical protein BZY88_02355 [SAR202 cluster bacterium Io17-Chloro-G9]
MPNILRVGPYRFFFYAGDRDEPPHVHVERGGKAVKFWLEPLRLQHRRGFRRAEINRMNKPYNEDCRGKSGPNAQ